MDGPRSPAVDLKAQGALRQRHQVSDVDTAREFFEHLFGLRCAYQRAGQLALLEDEAGFSLGVSNLRNSSPPEYPRDFHVGFVLERASDVREAYERIKAAGVAMKADLQAGGPNLVFQCLWPDAIVIGVRAPRDRE